MGTYRECAGVVLFNDEGKVLLLARADQKDFEWQFVQGGVENGEKPETAALRELKEETSVSSAEIILSLNEPICYDFPPEVMQKFALAGKKHIGQRMHWFLIYFKGNDDEIDLNTKIPEFKAYRWADIEEAYENIVYFKREVYRKVCDIFAPYIEAYIHRADV
jgi:putative (di)nucleoside polyphosphate hydrolase